MASNNNDQPRAVAIRPWAASNLTQLDPLSAAEHFVQSGYFTDAKDVSKAVVKILYGAEFGIPPVASMLNIHVIQGKPTMGAHMIGAILRRAGYDFRAVVTTNTECRILFYRRDQELGESTFTWEDAKRAELTGKDNWRHFPKAMLFARAMSQGARMHAPDAFMGTIYTPDELGADVSLDSEGNMAVVQDVTPEPAEQARDAGEPIPPCETFVNLVDLKARKLGMNDGDADRLMAAALRLPPGEHMDGSKLDYETILKPAWERVKALQSQDEALAFIEGHVAVTLRAEVARHLKRLKLREETATALHDLLIPGHEAHTPMSAEQARKILRPLGRFKDADAAIDWIGYEQDVRRKAQEPEGAVKIVHVDALEHPKWADPGNDNREAEPRDGLFPGSEQDL